MVNKRQNSMITTDQRGLTLLERKANLKIIAPRYKQATKKEKMKILDEFALNYQLQFIHTHINKFPLLTI